MGLGKSYGWVREKRGEVILHVLVIAPLIWFLEFLGHHLVQPGPIRDVGFYVVIVAALFSSVALLIWLGLFLKWDHAAAA
jgi:hypothetical protein